LPKPPSNRTNSIPAVSLTASGFFAVFLPALALSPLSSPPLLAQADRKLMVGTEISPSAADRLIRSRRPTPSVPWFSAEVDPMLKSSPSPGLRR
jgi:hypothetical protein